jgi:hypothetical protein
MRDIYERHLSLPRRSRYEHYPVQPVGFWTGVGSMIDLFGTYLPEESPEFEEWINSSLHDDAYNLYSDWVKALPEVTRDKRQLRLNFGPATSDK